MRQNSFRTEKYFLQDILFQVTILLKLPITPLANVLSVMDFKLNRNQVYARSNGGRLKLPAEVIASIYGYVQNDRHKPEV